MSEDPDPHGRGLPPEPSPPHDADHHDYRTRDHDHLVEPFFVGLPTDRGDGPAAARSLLARLVARLRALAGRRGE